MVPHWVVRQHHSEYEKSYLKDGEIMYSERPAATAPVALMRGPVVYALDMVWNPQISNDDADISRSIAVDTIVAPRQIALPAAGLLGPAYTAAVAYKGSSREVTLTPFANIGQWWRPGQEKPQTWSDAFTYAIWMNGVSK